jgi:ABC-type lipoprotein export system ATPase subunit
MVTHDPRIAAYGDEIVHLTDGKISDRLELDGAAGGDERAQAVLAWLQAAGA